MNTAFDTSPEFKKAAIDWLLTVGDHNSMTSSKPLALADLSVRGVDYVASDAPAFDTIDFGDGDSFHSGTQGRAFACEVFPLDRDPNNWREGYMFWVREEDLMSLLLVNMITGVIQAAEDGDASWKALADQREVARMTRNRFAASSRK